MRLKRGSRHFLRPCRHYPSTEVGCLCRVNLSVGGWFYWTQKLWSDGGKPSLAEKQVQHGQYDKHHNADSRKGDDRVGLIVVAIGMVDIPIGSH